MLPIPDPSPVSKPKPPKKGGIGRGIGKVVGGIGKKVGKKVRRSTGGGSGGGSSRRRNSSGGGGGSSRGGSNFRRSGNGAVKKATKKVSRGNPKPRGPMNDMPIKKPAIPGIDAYLGTDSSYQSALRSGKQDLASMLSELGRRRGEAGTQYTQTRGSMERDRTMQLEDLKNEFASRGLINSGLYGEEQGRFQQQFTEQMNALAQQQSALLADLLSQENNYKRENAQALEVARQQAIARRASKYNIG